MVLRVTFLSCLDKMIASFGDMDQASGKLVADPRGSIDEIGRAMEDTIQSFDRMVEIASVLRPSS